MKHFAVIGDPISQSLSPVLHNEVYYQLGIKASFEKIRVQPHALSEFMATHQLDGFNVTIPHKQTVLPFLDKIDEAAKMIGAVNCIFGNIGYNTDWIGFKKALQLNHVDLNGKACLILGAGGAARAIAYSLIQSGVSSISVNNRTQSKADELLDWIQSFSPNIIKTKSPEIIANCTPVGMWPDIDSSPNYNINKNHILIDTIYNPIETKWLKIGNELGAKTVSGLDMFIAQGLASMDVWFEEAISEKVNIDLCKSVLRQALDSV